MNETVGVLNLRIAQLERYLSVVKNKQSMSIPYPEHYKRLLRVNFELQQQLKQLIANRQALHRTLS